MSSRETNSRFQEFGSIRLSLFNSFVCPLLINKNIYCMMPILVVTVVLMFARPARTKSVACRLVSLLRKNRPLQSKLTAVLQCQSQPCPCFPPEYCTLVARYAVLAAALRMASGARTASGGHKRFHTNVSAVTSQLVVPGCVRQTCCCARHPVRS